MNRRRENGSTIGYCRSEYPIVRRRIASLDCLCDAVLGATHIPASDFRGGLTIDKNRLKSRLCYGDCEKQ